MAQAPQTRPTAAPQKLPPAPAGGVTVTYTPLEDGDPHTTVVHGIMFSSNKPKQVMRPDTIEMLKRNPWFKVGDHPQAQRKRADQPKTDVEYRAYFAKWIRLAKTSQEVKMRWDAEESLREQCNIGDEDLNFMLPVLSTTIEKMEKAEEAYEQEMSKAQERPVEVEH